MKNRLLRVLVLSVAMLGAASCIYGAVISDRREKEITKAGGELDTLRQDPTAANITKMERLLKLLSTDQNRMQPGQRTRIKKELTKWEPIVADLKAGIQRGGPVQQPVQQKDKAAADQEIYAKRQQILAGKSRTELISLLKGAITTSVNSLSPAEYNLDGIKTELAARSAALDTAIKASTDEVLRELTLAFERFARDGNLTLLANDAAGNDVADLVLGIFNSNRAIAGQDNAALRATLKNGIIRSVDALSAQHNKAAIKKALTSSAELTTAINAIITAQGLQEMIDVFALFSKDGSLARLKSNVAGYDIGDVVLAIFDAHAKGAKGDKEAEAGQDLSDLKTALKTKILAFVDRADAAAYDKAAIKKALPNSVELTKAINVLSANGLQELIEAFEGSLADLPNNAAGYEVGDIILKIFNINQKGVGQDITAHRARLKKTIITSVDGLKAAEYDKVAIKAALTNSAALTEAINKIPTINGLQEMIEAFEGPLKDLAKNTAGYEVGTVVIDILNAHPAKAADAKKKADDAGAPLNKKELHKNYAAAFQKLYNALPTANFNKKNIIAAYNTDKKTVQDLRNMTENKDLQNIIVMFEQYVADQNFESLMAAAQNFELSEYVLDIINEHKIGDIPPAPPFGDDTPGVDKTKDAKAKDAEGDKKEKEEKADGDKKEKEKKGEGDEPAAAGATLKELKLAYANAEAAALKTYNSREGAGSAKIDDRQERPKIEEALKSISAADLQKVIDGLNRYANSVEGDENDDDIKEVMREVGVQFGKDVATAITTN